jgi:hypothetical protein
VLDAVAAAGSVDNYNNRPNGPYVSCSLLLVFPLLSVVLMVGACAHICQKLYLFSLKTGAILPFGSALHEIETNVLDTGDCILLEMVANKKKPTSTSTTSS